MLHTYEGATRLFEHVCVLLFYVSGCQHLMLVGELFTFFTKAKISNLYISLRIQKQVIQLQISAS